MSTKEEIREQLLEKRNAFTPEQIAEMSRQIAFKLYQQDEFLEAQKLHIFTSFGSEPDTAAIREYALHLKKFVYVPVIERERREFHNVQVQPGMKYEPGIFGVPNPVFKNGSMKFIEKAELNLDEKDVVIVPLLAFDGKLHRLGYGHGYYDRFLNRNPAFKIGIAFDSQRVDDIPIEGFDVPLDMIITESEVLRAVPLKTPATLKTLDFPSEEEPERCGARAYGLPDEAVATEEVLKGEETAQPVVEQTIDENSVSQTEEITQEVDTQHEITEAPKKKAVKVFGGDDVPDMPKREE
jgi:5-formyltetrahydrofolate cyclo-ligase